MTPTTRRRTRLRRRRQAGFNMVEVMVAMVVLMVAVVGASSLQTATTRANMAARNRTHATEFLQTWVERVKIDAMAWQPGQQTPALFGNGRADGQWFHLDATDLDANVGTMAADFWGADVGESATDLSAARNVRYCVDLRGQLISAGTLRADVRVWWHREGGSNLQGTFTQDLPDGGTQSVSGPIATDYSLADGCDTGGQDITSDPRIYSITASTTLVAMH